MKRLESAKGTLGDTGHVTTALSFHRIGMEGQQCPFNTLVNVYMLCGSCHRHRWSGRWGRNEVRWNSLGSAYMTDSLQKSPPELAAGDPGTWQEVEV